jgi:hypothetical protein
VGERGGHRGTRRVLIDLTPLRRSRDLRCRVLFAYWMDVASFGAGSGAIVLARLLPGFRRQQNQGAADTSGSAQEVS